MDGEDIINKYIHWIKDNTFSKTIEIGKSCSLTTPFLDRHNDHLEIYIIKNANSYILTDDGFTISDLKMSGLEINSPKRMLTLKSTLHGFGVMLGENNELFINSELPNIGQKKHNLLQAILAVNDMYVLSQENIYSFFKEDVERYFQANEIYFSKDIKITGKSGFDHNIDFIISSSKRKPERLIRTISAPRKDSVMSALFSFEDIRGIRQVDTKNFVIYNDLDRNISPDIESALSSYQVESFPWSKKNSLVGELSLN